MKKTFLSLLTLSALVIFGCKDKETSCIVGKWTAQINATGAGACEMVVEYKANGTGSAKVYDCTNHCQQNLFGQQELINYQEFTYTVDGNTIKQTVKGKVIACGSPMGEDNISTSGTFSCNGNTLSGVGGGGSQTFTRVQ